MCIFMILFFAVLFFLVLTNYHKQIPYATYLKKMVWSKEGFNWTSVTALAALLGLFITSITNNMGVKANIISKERAKWLDAHKENMANYLKESREIEVLCNGQLDITKECLDKPKNTLDEEQQRYLVNMDKINKKQQNMVYYKNVLSLGLSEDDEENINFLNNINNLIDSTDKYREETFLLGEKSEKLRELDLINDFKDLDYVKEYKKSVDELIGTSKRYYKDVWKEIKKGK